MITYKHDQEGRYHDLIGDALGAYNDQFTGVCKAEHFYVYIIEKDVLVAGLKATSFWDWVTIGNHFYTHIDHLKDMVDQVYRHFADRVQGIKVQAPEKKRFADFLEVGFKHVGTIPGTRVSPDWYHADLITIPVPRTHDADVITTTEPIEEYQKKIDGHMDTFYQESHVTPKSGVLRIVATENDRLIGGVTCDLYGDTIYVSWLVVDEEYRGKGIGKTLMTMVQEEAVKQNIAVIELGTCEFQAKGFYEKLGYEVLMTRDDYPKGYQNYSMAKRL